MVFKPRASLSNITPRFENDVKEYGIQTVQGPQFHLGTFENDVKEYGIQTTMRMRKMTQQFENDVKEYGIQTENNSYLVMCGLRMM